MLKSRLSFDFRSYPLPLDVCSLQHHIDRNLIFTQTLSQKRKGPQFEVRSPIRPFSGGAHPKARGIGEKGITGTGILTAPVVFLYLWFDDK